MTRKCRGAILAQYRRVPREQFPRRFDYRRPYRDGRGTPGAADRRGCKGSGEHLARSSSQAKGIFGAFVLLAVCGVCYTLDLDKSALLALLLSVLLIAKLGGAKSGIVAAGIAAALFVWCLPPNGSLTVSGLDGRLALALFVIGSVVSSVVVEGTQWLKRWITSSDPDR